jgi:hypothetical protein
MTMQSRVLVLVVTLLATLVSATSAAEDDQSSSGLKLWRIDGTFVAYVVSTDQTHLFFNNNLCGCYHCVFSGKWQPTAEPGLLSSADRKRLFGLLPWHESQMPGQALIPGVIAGHVKERTLTFDNAPKSSEVLPFESTFPGSVVWTGQWLVKRDGKKLIAVVTRYIAEVSPGCAAVVTVGGVPDRVQRDTAARSILDTIENSRAEDCWETQFRPQIQALIRQYNY